MLMGTVKELIKQLEKYDGDMKVIPSDVVDEFDEHIDKRGRKIKPYILIG